MSGFRFSTESAKFNTKNALLSNSDGINCKKASYHPTYKKKLPLHALEGRLLKKLPIHFYVKNDD